MGGPVERACALFRSTFAAEPRWAASAPGRVNIIGEHTDYNDGFVLPVAIAQRTAVAAAPSTDGRWHLASEQQPTPASFDATSLADPHRRDWTSYIRGVIAGFRAAGHQLEPLFLAVASDVPVGGGLSSSAALEVATATALEAASGRSLDPWEKILLCQQAEHAFAGVPCGVMDQAVSVLGEPAHALLLDCRDRRTRPVAFDTEHATILVMNSMVHHELSGGEYAARRASCAAAVEALRHRGYPELRTLRDADQSMLPLLDRPGDEPLARAARHVVTENARVVSAVAAIEASDFAELGALMLASHTSLRDDYRVSCSELDLLVALAIDQPGVLGARMTGGGFGGCIVALVEPSRAGAVARAVADAYRNRRGLTADWFITSPSTGAAPESPR